MKEVIWAVLKILGFLLILPLIIASVIAFQNQVLSLPVNKEACLLWGAGCYVALNLFVYNLKDLYVFGSSLVEKVITFFKPAGYLVPLYAIFLLILNMIIWIMGRGHSFQPFFLFGLAFTLAMHLIMTAHAIYEGDKGLLKAHYLLIFGLVLVANFFIMSLFLAGAITEYSFVGFIKSFSSHTLHFYKSVYKGLFIDS